MSKIDRVKEYIYITIGFLIVASAIEFFLAPNKIAAGGVSGIAIIINNFFPKISVGLIMLMLNIILFIIAFIFIGGKFGAKTIYSSLGLSGSIWILDRITQSRIVVTNDLLLATIFGTFLSGIGMGIVFNQDASTGGTDIIAKILNKFFHIDIGKGLLSVDFIVTIFAGAAFGAQIGLYAILSVIMNGLLIDNVIAGLNRSKAIMIISRKSDIINEYILKELHRSCTIFEGKGGFSGHKKDILYTILGSREYVRLREYIKEIDKGAFLIITDAHEVLGEGFKDLMG